MINKDKITPGSVCVVDKDNKLKLDVTGKFKVQIIKLVRKRTFKTAALWEVQDLQGGPNIVIPEDLLTPCDDTMCVIRFPLDMPIFNDNDIKGIDDAIIIIKAYNATKISDGKLCDATLKRLNALKEKMEFNMKMREV